MKRFKQLLASLALVFGFALAPVAVGAVNVDPLGNACASGNSNSEICQSADDDIGDIMRTVINVLLFVVGIISVVMIIVGGIMYATSAGDSGAVGKAKNTILFAVVGLVVAFVAYAIVNWVVQLFA